MGETLDFYLILILSSLWLAYWLFSIPMFVLYMPEGRIRGISIWLQLDWSVENATGISNFLSVWIFKEFYRRRYSLNLCAVCNWWSKASWRFYETTNKSAVFYCSSYDWIILILSIKDYFSAADNTYWQEVIMSTNSIESWVFHKTYSYFSG